MAAKKRTRKTKPSLYIADADMRRIARRHDRLEHLSGLLWVFRNNRNNASIWAELEEAHDKHRHAVSRGR